MCGFNLKLNDPGAGKVSYAEYVKLVYKWHVRSCKFSSTCLEDKEYMSIRNVLAVLSKLVEFLSSHRANRQPHDARGGEDQRRTNAAICRRWRTDTSPCSSAKKAKWRADNVFNPYLPPDPKEIAAREVKPKADGEREKAAEKGEGGGGGARRGGRGGKDAREALGGVGARVHADQIKRKARTAAAEGNEAAAAAAAAVVAAAAAARRWRWARR